MSSQRSFNIPRSGSPIQNKSQNRARAISLLDQQAPNVSPVKESPFGLLRANTKKAHPPASQPNSARDKGSQPSSLDVSDDQNNRYSFGLPKISADPAKPIFDGLGLSPTKPNTPAGMRVTSDPQGYANSPRAPDFTQPGSNGHSGFGLGDVDTEPPPVPPRPSMEEARPSRAREGEIDAAEGWRNERVLYQCACVADLSVNLPRAPKPMTDSLSPLAILPRWGTASTGVFDSCGWIRAISLSGCLAMITS